VRGLEDVIDLEPAGDFLEAAGDFLRQGLALDHAGTGDQEHRPVDSDLEMGKLHGCSALRRGARRIHGKGCRLQSVVSPWVAGYRCFPRRDLSSTASPPTPPSTRHARWSTSRLTRS